VQGTDLRYRDHNIRRPLFIRRQITPKPDTYQESMDVYVAGISVKEFAYCPGRPLFPPCAAVIARCRDGLAEVRH